MDRPPAFEPSALTFDPHLEPRVWGGRRLEALGRPLPPEVPIGESWEISAVAGRSSRLQRGSFGGRTFRELVDAHGPDVIGPHAGARAFPLLVKLLDAAAPLSVQLHPRDEEAARLEGGGESAVGKTEAWCVLEAKPGAEIIHGLARDVEPEAFFRRMAALDGGKLPEDEERSWFHWVRVRRGDVVFLPAGTIHALGAGILLAEVQQSSDLTYRIYDWGRVDPEGRTRELHIEKARKVQVAEPVPCPLLNIEDVPGDRPMAPLLTSEIFHFDLLTLPAGGVHRGDTRSPAGPRLELLFGWEGVVSYRGPGGDALDVHPAAWVLLPAELGGYELAASQPSRAVIVRAGPRNIVGSAKPIPTLRPPIQ